MSLPNRPPGVRTISSPVAPRISYTTSPPPMLVTRSPRRSFRAADCMERSGAEDHGQIGGAPAKRWRPLLQERCDAFLAVADRRVEHRQRVGEVRLQGICCTAVAVQHLLREAKRDR